MKEFSFIHIYIYIKYFYNILLIKELITLNKILILFFFFYFFLLFFFLFNILKIDKNNE